MTETTSHPFETAGDRELVITRVYAAPRELVFKTWTEPQHVVRWWGPRGCTTTIQEMDVRPGGVWRYVMRTADGTDWTNRIRYREVVVPERLVYDHGSDVEDDPNGFHVITEFHDRGQQTEVVMRMQFASVEARDRAAGYAGANSTFDRLHELLDDLAVEFVVRREFAAPRELVYRAFTEADRLARWWGPKGFTMQTRRHDPRPGGIFHYSMRAADGHEMWGKMKYVELAPPERLVFVNSFADGEGNIIAPPFADDWPQEILHTITLTEQDGKTLVTLRGLPIHATPAQRATFLAGHASMQGGYGSSLDQLTELLAAE